jgi:hypothetical protein
MQRGVTVEQVRGPAGWRRRRHQVGMFLMWGYEGEELEDIAATVEHVKASNPTSSSPQSPIPSRARAISRKCANA